MKAHIGKMDGIRQGYAARVADLKRQADGLLITTNEQQVFSLRAKTEAKAAMAEAAKVVGGALLAKFKSPDRTAGDDFARGYWDPKGLDSKAIEMHAEQLQRKLERTETGPAARAIVDQYRHGSKEEVYALWKSAPAIRGHRRPEVKMLSEQAERGLRDRLERDPQYIEATRKQDALAVDVAAAVKSLDSITRSEAGGFDPNRTGPFYSQHPNDTGRWVADHFETRGGVSAFFADANKRGDEDYRPDVVGPHRLPPDTDGIF